MTKAYRLEKFWNRLRRWEGRVTDALSNQCDGLGNVSNHIFAVGYCQNYCPQTKLYSLVSKCHMLLLLQWNRREHMRTCVISNQGTTPGRCSPQQLALLSLDADSFIGFINFDFRTYWEENKSLKNVTSINWIKEHNILHSSMIQHKSTGSRVIQMDLIPVLSILTCSWGKDYDRWPQKPQIIPLLIPNWLLYKTETPWLDYFLPKCSR